MSKRERIEEARKVFGPETVSEVLMLVGLSDPDGAYSHFEDMGMEDHAACVDLVYFCED
jgi:hypothetical protein